MTRQPGLRTLVPALLLLDPDDRPGGRSSDDLVRDRAYPRMWLASGAATAGALLAVAVNQALHLESRIIDLALTALVMLPGCTFVVMVAATRSRRTFARRTKRWTFLYGASAGGCAATAAMSWLWEALGPIV